MSFVRISTIDLALVVSAGFPASSAETSASSEPSDTTQATVVEEPNIIPSKGDFAGLVVIDVGRRMYMECSHRAAYRPCTRLHSWGAPLKVS